MKIQELKYIAAIVDEVGTLTIEAPKKDDYSYDKYEISSDRGVYAECGNENDAKFIIEFTPKVAIEVIERLEAAERERDELRHSDYLMWHSMACKNGERAQKAEAELARRDAAAAAAAASEPVAWQYRYNDGKVGDWKTVDSEQECNQSPCYERRVIYTAAPPAVLPPEKHVPPFLTHQAGKAIGWNDCIAEALKLGAQQQKVVELPMPFDVAINLTRECGDIDYRHHESGEHFDRDEILAALDAANVPYEVKK